MQQEISKYLDGIQDDLIKFTSELIQIESLTGHEAEATKRVAEEMEKLGYDEVTIDSHGSVLGRVGNGDVTYLYDAHIDVVPAKDANDWTHPPFSGKIVDGFLWGRGSVDTKSSVCSMVYAGHALKELGLLEGKTVLISASVMEEDYDGELLSQAIEENNIKADYCIIGEPSDLNLAVGHRGRAMYKITTTGVSCHGSAPNNGVNSIYKMAKIIQNVENQQKEFDKLEGEKGSVVLSHIESRTASLNAVPDLTSIFLDRRLALGETEEMVAEEMDKIIDGSEATWEIYNAVGKAATGKEVVLRTFLPAWETDSSHELVLAAKLAISDVTDVPKEIFKWEFSTNGYATNGKNIVPTIGVGPGDMNLAHMKDERCSISDIVKASKIYACLAIRI
ncbi:selenium metabolism hydrolase [Vibrio sp. MACH09]|uniref:YgeY family selenium metabolism-linked hydrolase n=1 Tax=Vibrio sp. MACH09 TaxID=3025122 RepID=UPI0027931DC4|nr:YgeY family selenium metabolism-linked hydrolase [Vibrio sp. MACH09]GLO61105.1 selenium metabolism hydrolase [Vibrio sp. MACH09]